MIKLLFTISCALFVQLLLAKDQVDITAAHNDSFAIHAPDSTPIVFSKQTLPFDTINLNLHTAWNFQDSLPSIQSYEDKIDSIKVSLSHRIDSLGRMQFPSDKLNEEIHSLSSILDSLNRAGPLREIDNAKKNVSDIQLQAQERIRALEDKINEKLSLPDGGIISGKAGLNTPENILLPSSSEVLPNISLNDDLSLPGNPLNEVSIPSADITQNTALPDVQDVKIPEVSELEMPAIEGTENLAEVQSKFSEVNQITGQVQGYREDVQSVTQGNPEKIQQFSEDLESKVEEFEAMSEIQKLADMKKRYEDPEVMKEEALNKAKETAVNHFAGHEEELKAAMEKFAKIRAKYPDTEGVIDLMAKRPNPVKTLSFKERLVPGITMQLQKPNSLWVDFNPNLTYKLTGRFNIGLGWNERIAYNTRDREFDNSGRIYGVRSFVHVKFKSGFWLKGDVECMNTIVPPIFTSTPDQYNREWVWSYFAGFKKDFQLSKGVSVNIQTMYNLVDPENKSPYANRLNLRVGFEFPIKYQPKEKNKP